MCTKICVAVPIAVMSVFVMLYIRCIKPPSLPIIDDKDWAVSADTASEPVPEKYKIRVPEEVIECLKERLKNTTLTPPLQGVGFQYGFNTDYLKEVISYWITKYNWAERENLLNSVPHYRIKISGLNIHYIHVKPVETNGRKVIPLLLLHGWPGSVKEFYQIFPLLTKPSNGYNFVFEVIAPSLPGFGFSDAAKVPGLGVAQMALLMKKFMNAIGFEKFYVQGGDWGAIIGSSMATLYPENVIGFHSNMCSSRTYKGLFKLAVGSLWPSLIVEKQYEDRVYPLWEKIHFLIEESGYLHLQATKPDTCGVALRNDPAGLAAYILEKFSTWVNPTFRQFHDGGLGRSSFIGSSYSLSLDDLLDNVMIYWITGSITSSMRLYSEASSKAQINLNLDSIPTDVPTVCTAYPNELIYYPETVLREKYNNLLYLSHPEKGGHFAAFEQPAIFADDLWRAVHAIENYWKSKK